MHFKRSSVICFNLDQSKRLSSGNGLTLYKTSVLHQFKMKALNFVENKTEVAKTRTVTKCDLILLPLL